MYCEKQLLSPLWEILHSYKIRKSFQTNKTSLMILFPSVQYSLQFQHERDFVTVLPWETLTQALLQTRLLSHKTEQLVFSRPPSTKGQAEDITCQRLLRNPCGGLRGMQFVKSHYYRFSFKLPDRDTKKVGLRPISYVERTCSYVLFLQGDQD